ncbi:hypothetical protein SAMN02745172_01905 [Pseudoxanthobacter soli DSM 19599]|uniref:Uncharacterized protein n=1 Tax=Pseudoxanthobacter soli DSM 19599 TaxID=1123029 RepID=A0A1M7ZJ06_9HYPH|nr:hypothetical protein SAMN02745172_01905 [Pseudoxanthobacter soli DSM 19599]
MLRRDSKSEDFAQITPRRNAMDEATTGAVPGLLASASVRLVPVVGGARIDFQRH